MTPSPNNARKHVLRARIMRRFKKFVSKKRQVKENVGRLLSQIAGGGNSKTIPRNVAVQLSLLNKTARNYVGSVNPNIEFIKRRAATKLQRIRNILNKVQAQQNITPNEMKLLSNSDPSFIKGRFYLKNLYTHHRRPPNGLMRTRGVVYIQPTASQLYKSQGMRKSGFGVRENFTPRQNNVSKSLLRSVVRKWKRFHRQ